MRIATIAYAATLIVCSQAACSSDDAGKSDAYIAGGDDTGSDTNGADVAAERDVLDSPPEADAETEVDAACAQALPSSTRCTVVGGPKDLQPNCTEAHPLYVDCLASNFLGVDCTASGALPEAGHEIKCCRCVNAP